METIEVRACNVICQSQGSSLYYGDDNTPGGNINNGNYVDGGEF